MLVKNFELIIEYPVRLYNYYNIREEDREIIKDLFYTKSKRNLKKLAETIEFLRPDIEKVGKEKVYFGFIDYAARINLKKLISPRKLFRNNIGKLVLRDKNYLKQKNLKRIRKNDREICDEFMSREFFKWWIDWSKEERSKYSYFFSGILGKKSIMWFITMIMKYGNPYN